MKIIAFSDSHGNPDLLRDALSQAMRGMPIDVCIHCGDGVRDLDAVAPILMDANPNTRLYGVRGNCDLAAAEVPTLELFDVGGIRMMASHGHLFNVKHGLEGFCCAAEARGAQIAFFGHTHRPFLEMVRGVYLINPGAICAHMPGNIAYAQVVVQPGGAYRADLMPWLM
ncbi:MAG: YfcE family phosphodiesterase [Candidatus Limiplasma sp.]|nr:YfcE family phosphodiesterase [Candidatus Limiplasma sp.]MEA5144810.1 YfcE family phosphodiesterase [Candidatus Limiplasma sp.]